MMVVVYLWPKVSRPVRLGVGLPFGAHDQILFPYPFFSDNPSGRIGPGIYSASNRNEQQKQTNNVSVE
jgi:hypothetical protein